MKIQIVCRDAEEAKFCCDNGVDSIGLPVGQKYFSKDFISKTKAKAIIKLLPPFCTATMITHLESAQEIVDIAKFCGFSCIQLHSYISESEVKKIKAALPYVKILRLMHIDENGKILSAMQFSLIQSTFKHINLAERARRIILIAMPRLLKLQTSRL